MQDLIVNKLTNCDTNDEYYSYTVDVDGEFLTVLMLDGNIIGIFKHIAVHDRFYCDSLYGDADVNAEFAERIDTLLMEEAERSN